jgi:hypothetical protein
MLAEARIEAEAVCLVDPDQAAISSACADAALVLVAMRIRGDAALDALGGDLDLLLRRLPMTAAVLAGEPVDLLAGPESGHHVTVAEAEEVLAEAKARLKTMEGRLSEATAAVDDARLWAVPDDPEDDAEIEELNHQRETVLRRTMKARARVELAQAEVDRVLGG